MPLPTCVCMLSPSVMSDFLRPHGLQPTGSFVHGISQARILDWVAISFSGGVFLTQGSNLGLPHCRRILYCLGHQGSPCLFIYSCLNTWLFFILKTSESQLFGFFGQKIIFSTYMVDAMPSAGGTLMNKNRHGLGTHITYMLVGQTYWSNGYPNKWKITTVVRLPRWATWRLYKGTQFTLLVYLSDFPIPCHWLRKENHHHSSWW